MHCDVRWGVGAQVMRVVDYVHFALHKFESLSITLWYNALPVIIFDRTFHTSSTKPKPYTNFSHNHNVHSRLQRTSRLTTHFHMYLMKCNIFGIIGHIWPPNTIIESISHNSLGHVYVSALVSLFFYLWPCSLLLPHYSNWLWVFSFSIYGKQMSLSTVSHCPSSHNNYIYMK